MNDKAPPEVGPDEPGTWVPEQELRRIARLGLLVAAVFGLLCVVGAILNPVQLLRSYLVAFLYWLALPLGCLGIAMVGQLSPGGWSVVLRRTLEAASRTIPLMALLFVPVLLGIHSLYAWAGHAAGEVSVQLKSAYLNVGFFTARAVLYFALWSATAFALSRLSLEQDRTADPLLGRKLRKLSALGLVVYCATMTFAAVDWMMSLDHEWWSTIYGVYVIGGQAVSAMAFATIVALLLVGRSGRRVPIRTRHFHDFGKMLLAFVMLWAYFAISQLIVIWSGNLPEDIPFYIDRIRGGYRWLSLVLVILHFAVPFLLLLPRDLKRRSRALAGVAALLLVMRWVDVYWLVAPAWSPEGVRLHWLDVVPFLAIGGVWTSAFAWQLGKRPLLPLGEPLLKEAIENG